MVAYFLPPTKLFFLAYKPLFKAIVVGACLLELLLKPFFAKEVPLFWGFCFKEVPIDNLLSLLRLSYLIEGGLFYSGFIPYYCKAALFFYAISS